MLYWYKSWSWSLVLVSLSGLLGLSGCRPEKQLLIVVLYAVFLGLLYSCVRINDLERT